MDQKALMSNIITAVATATILGVIGWAGGVFSAGADALDEDQIRTVLDAAMKTTINGETKTYGEVLSILSTNDTVILSEIGHLKEDISDLEDSIGILTSP